MLVKELGKEKSAVLHYMDSGEVSGDRKKVVGYLAAALY
jgi:AmmeMemoRadiSam system protein B